MVGLMVGGMMPALAQDFSDKLEVPTEFDVTVNPLGDEPLYLISSMKTAKVITKDQFEKINQDHVDYIQIINDPASTHIYGDKAKFGVVLVVMKSNSFSAKYVAKKRKHQ
jgi:hypothetical protein